MTHVLTRANSSLTVSTSPRGATLLRMLRCRFRAFSACVPASLQIDSSTGERRLLGDSAALQSVGCDSASMTYGQRQRLVDQA